jgi:predicted O-methyltransferase YrrM
MKIKHFYRETEGENWFNYQNLYSDVVRKFDSGAHFVEVGTWKGKSACYMAVEIINSEKDIKFDCVDTWEFVKGERIAIHKFDDLFNIFKKNIEPVKNKINIIKSISWDAASRYDDSSLDFVFLDAGHNYESIKKDIQTWLPKVKVGGILAGHDWQLKGVKKAVLELIPESKVRTFPLNWSSWEYEK